MKLDALESGLASLTAAKPKPRTEAPGAAESFVREMGTALDETNRALNDADAAARELTQGKGDVVDTMLALGRADVSLRMVVGLRNRMLESYQEIMRLQV